MATSAPQQPVGLGLRILCIEDDDEIREALVGLLEDAGYEVSAAPNAQEGLARLDGGAFHLIITDYALPGQTGVWMLEEAARRGLLNGTQAVIVTAYRDVTGPPGVRVFHKPLDLDQFLGEVEQMLLPARDEELRRSADKLREIAGTPRPAGEPPRLQLVLYVSGSSPSSLKAIRNLGAVLREYQADAVALEICDLARGYPPSGEEDRIAFTPTLVKRSPAPRAWVIGNLEDRGALTDLLEGAGVARRA